jgi:hypothetical protein
MPSGVDVAAGLHFLLAEIDIRSSRAGMLGDVVRGEQPFDFHKDCSRYSSRLGAIVERLPEVHR